MSGSPITEDLKTSYLNHDETGPLIKTDVNTEASWALPTNIHYAPNSRIRGVWQRFLNLSALVVSEIAMFFKNLPGGARVFNTFSYVFGVLRALMYVISCFSVALLTAVFQHREQLKRWCPSPADAEVLFCKYPSQLKAMTDQEFVSGNSVG